MAKVIKLKQSDIQKIVENIIKENEGFDDFDAQVQPEEMPGGSDYEEELTLGQDGEGNFYVMKNGDSDNPEVIFKTK
jgi:hypothetical protein